MQTSSFKDFYDNRFGSGHAVANHFDSELTDEASNIGVNWPLISNSLSWQSGKAGKKNVNGKKLLGGFKHSVGVYASFEYDNNGVEYPLVTFKSKGGAGETVVFNGLSYLWELFKQEKNTEIPQEKLDAWNKKKREREEENSRKREAARLEQEEENKRRAANVKAELLQHDQLPRAAKFVYTDEKQISSILSKVNARAGQNHFGNFISLKLQYLNGKPAGIQRIYDRLITKKDGNKTNKDFTWGLDKDGAHLIIGDLQTASKIFATEGFATGASIYLAMQTLNISCAIIVALDAANLKKVMREYHKKAPYLQIMPAVDNDMWKQRAGKGNAGMAGAIELLEEIEGLKAYAPNFEKIDPIYQPTDFNDLHTKAGLKEVARQLKGNLARVKFKGDLFEKAQQRIKYVSFANIMKEAIKCVQVGMQVGLPKYKPSEIIISILDTAENANVPRNKIDAKKLAKQADKIWNAKIHDAQAFRSFSSRIKNKDLRPEHITYQKFNKTIVDDEVLDYIKNLDGIVIVRFPMGSRKTQGIIKPMMWEADKAAFFAHRVSLIGGAWDALNKDMPSTLMPVTHYKDPILGETLGLTNKLTCCINSCLKSDFGHLLNNLDTLCFDEAAQTLRHVTAGGAVKYPVQVFNRMIEMMATTRDNVILADADANDTLVDFCELGLKQRNAHLQALYGESTEPQKIHIIDGHTDCSDTSIYYTDSDTAFQKAVEDVAAGHKVLIANDSANDGEKLFTHLQSMHPDKKGLFISLDTKENNQVERFTDNPNVESKQYDYLIYSPSISSGVSIENEHFKKHYGIFCGTVAPSDAIQMIRRDRNAREFVVGLSTIHNKREESAMNMWLGMILANDSQLAVELNSETRTIEVKTGDLDFDLFRLELIAQENKAKNDFANNLLCILYADGYKINSLDTTDIDKEKGQAAKEAARNTLKAIDINRHLSEQTPTQEKRDNLLNKANITREEKAQLNRFNIENFLMMDVNEDSIDFHHKSGLNKAKLFELLHLTADKARAFDKSEIGEGIQPSNRTYSAKQSTALKDFFEIAGLDRETGAGETTEERLTAAIEHLITDKNIHLFNNWYRFGGYVNPFSRNLKPVNKAKSILEALGLKLNTRQLGRNNSDSLKRQRYNIDPSSWEFMNDIHKRRTEAHVTSFKENNLDGMMIHSSSCIYIDNKNEMDQPKTAPLNTFTWFSLLKQGIENLCIPREYTSKVMDEVNLDEGLKKSPPIGGMQEVISGIYQRLSGLNPVTS